MNSLNQVDKINRENKKLMKNADRIVFRLRKNNEDYLSSIECAKSVKVDGFETDVREEINCKSLVSVHEKRDSSYSYDVISGCSSISFSKNDLTWQTIVKNMKKDDEILIEWIIGDSSITMRNKNMVMDSVRLHILREGLKKLSFNVTTDVTEKDNIARSFKLERVYE